MAPKLLEDGVLAAKEIFMRQSLKYLPLLLGLLLIASVVLGW